LACLGLHFDAAANLAVQPDNDIATASSPGRILVVHTREDLVVVRETVRLVRPG
jgi:acetate kinase